MRKGKILSKHKIIMRLIKISDTQHVSQYYSDPILSRIPSPDLQAILFELAEQKYLKKNIRHVVLTYKCYQYPHEHQKEVIWKIFTAIARPFSLLISWCIGVASALLIEYLINILEL